MPMPNHPSLTAPFVPPEPLKPVASMNAYTPCWCRSNKKFKFCHYPREQQKAINIFEEEQKMLGEFRQGYCSHPEAGTACSPKITDAHTVQRRGGLTSISEAGHVLTIKPSMQALIDHEGAPPPRRIGIGRASVFPGFCNAHDSATFRPIEGQDVALDLPAAFLFAYRTIAYERFTKAAALKTVEIQREMDRGQPFWKQALIQQSIHGYAWALRSGCAMSKPGKPPTICDFFPATGAASPTTAYVLIEFCRLSAAVLSIPNMTLWAIRYSG
nr:hypothetical protein [uncultured Rhodopila sp.]